MFADTKEISCENVGDAGWHEPVNTAKTCSMMATTSINEPNVTISTRDESVQGLEFTDNKKIFHLPINVVDSFPNLLGYDGHGCNIKEISLQNLKGLSKLNQLFLQGNQLEKISSNTFDDLVALQELCLRERKNKIL